MVRKAKSGSAPRRKRTPKGPRHVRPKTGLDRLKFDGKVTLADGYVEAQVTSSIGAKVLKQAADVKDTRDVAVTKHKEHAALLALAVIKEAEVVAADTAFDIALESFAHDGAIAAGKDSELLKSLSIAEASPRAAAVVGAPGKPATPGVDPGKALGTSTVSMTKPRGATSMLVQWRLDGSPADSWSGSFGTKRTSLALDKLPPGALIRVRVQAIGDGMSEWSEEGLGRVA